MDQGAEVNFTITLKNTSAVAINGITVKDDAGNEVRKDISLNPNASTNISYKTTVAESHNYYFVAEFPAGGSTKSEQSAEVPITVSGSFLFSMTVTPINQNPEIPGDVEFKITLTADGSITLKDIVITEAKLGQIETLAELAPAPGRSPKPCALKRPATTSSRPSPRMRPAPPIPPPPCPWHWGLRQETPAPSIPPREGMPWEPSLRCCHHCHLTLWPLLP